MSEKLPGQIGRQERWYKRMADKMFRECQTDGTENADKQKNM